eukprot:g2199.t1
MQTNAAGEGFVRLGETSKKRVTYREFRGTKLVDIREYYTAAAEGGEQKPGRKGIALTEAQYRTFLSLKDRISEALNDDDGVSGGHSDDDGDYEEKQKVFQLSSTRRVTVREYKGRDFVDIREFYEKDGAQLPGKKGISLSVSEWQSVPELSIFETTNETSTATTASAPTKTSAGEEDRKRSFDGEKREESNKRARSEAEASANSEEATTVQHKTNADGDLFFELNAKGTRRLTLRTYKGHALFDIREYYEKDGELKPGRKGISLNTDQWKRLLSVASTLPEATTGS